MSKKRELIKKAKELGLTLRSDAKISEIELIIEEELVRFEKGIINTVKKVPFFSAKQLSFSELMNIKRIERMRALGKYIEPEAEAEVFDEISDL